MKLNDNSFNLGSRKLAKPYWHGLANGCDDLIIGGWFGEPLGFGRVRLLYVCWWLLPLVIQVGAGSIHCWIPG